MVVNYEQFRGFGAEALGAEASADAFAGEPGGAMTPGALSDRGGAEGGNGDFLPHPPARTTEWR